MTFDVETLKVTDQHKALAAFIKTEAGKAPSPATVALVLTLATEYRKSETYLEQQAARQKAKDDRAAALVARKQARMDRALKTARKLAAELGLDMRFTEDYADPEPAPIPYTYDDPEDNDPTLDAEPPEPVVKAPAKRKTAGPKAATISAVPDVEDVSPGDPAEDTSAIVVVEADDFFEEPSAEPDGGDYDDFVDDPDEPEEY